MTDSPTLLRKFLDNKDKGQEEKIPKWNEKLFLNVFKW
jgi:hypothetical protein